MSDSSDSEDDFQADRMQSLLSSYYGVATEEPVAEGDEETKIDSLDSNNFDATEYAQAMLQNESLAGLLDRDAALVREIKTIDTDMKSLVHENYNKFISATDTIRSMRTNVEEMEEKMNELKSDMDSIYVKAEDITSQLAPTRTKIEKLVSVRQLLKKLEFLFELPLRLSRSIELKAYAQAVKYYSTARGVLNDHLDVPSFRNILVEADAIISKLKADVQSWIQVDEISSPKLAQYIKLLLSLDEDSSLLHIRYVEWHRRRLKWMMHRHSFEVTNDNVNRPGDGWPFETFPVDKFVSALKRSVVQGFVDMCHMYVGIFGRTAGLEAGDLHPELLQFGSELFVGFFSLCKKKILQSPVAVEHPVAHEQEKRPLSAGLDTLSGAMQTMQQCAQLMHQLVPKFRAHDRLAETLENAIRHRIEMIFKTLHRSTIDRLLVGCKTVDTATTDDAQMLSQDVTQAIGQVLSSLRPLVEIGTDIMADMPQVFADLVQGQLHAYFLWFNSVVENLTENDDHSLIVTDWPERVDGRPIHGQHNFETWVSKPVTLGPDSAGIALFLAAVSKQVEATGVPTALQMLTENMPYLEASEPRTTRAPGGVDVPNVLRHTRATTQHLLHRYVHLLADRVMGVVQERFCAVDWLKHGEPRSVSVYCTDFLDVLHQIVDEVRRIGGLEFDLCTIPRRPVFKLPTVTGGALRGSGVDSGSAEPGIRLNIERLFTQKLKLYDDIMFSAQSILAACITVALKTLYELARRETFAKFGYQQSQIDASFLRVLLPRFGVRLDGPLDALLDEFIGSVHARCIAPMDIDIAVVDSIVSKQRAVLGV